MTMTRGQVAWALREALHRIELAGDPDRSDAEIEVTFPDPHLCLQFNGERIAYPLKGDNWQHYAEEES